MKPNSASIPLAVLASALCFVARGTAQSRRPPQPTPMDSIPLKDYQPDSSLVVPETHLPKTRFSVIDVHAHVYANIPEELKIPVNIHIADHPSAWRPPDAHQERSPAFQRYNQYGKDVLFYEELLRHRDRLLDRHSRTTFIFCHLTNQGKYFASAAAVLDRFPNLYYDIAARTYELGCQPSTAAKFMIRYKDSLLFGTDMGREKSSMQALHGFTLLY